MQPAHVREQSEENGKGDGEKTKRMDAGKEENGARAKEAGKDKGEYERKQKWSPRRSEIESSLAKKN